MEASILWSIYLLLQICTDIILSFFIHPSLDGTYYGMALSVHPSICPSIHSSVRPTEFQITHHGVCVIILT